MYKPQCSCCGSIHVEWDQSLQTVTKVSQHLCGFCEGEWQEWWKENAINYFEGVGPGDIIITNRRELDVIMYKVFQDFLKENQI